MSATTHNGRGSRRFAWRIIPCTMVLLTAAGLVTPGLLAQETLDQSNVLEDGANTIFYHMPIGQEFIPSMSQLTGVDVLLRESFDLGPDVITVNIRKGTITSPVLATTSQVVQQCTGTPTTPYTCGLIHFDFPSALPVAVGDVYVLELQATIPTHGWTRADDLYPRGASILLGEVDPTADFSFQTYGQASTEVGIDIRPGDSENSIDTSSKGVIPVAILTTPTFDASTLNPLSICFGDADTPSHRDCKERHSQGHLEDVDKDGDLDLLLHFQIAHSGIELGDTSACLSGVTVDGTPIKGCDTVRTH